MKRFVAFNGVHNFNDYNNFHYIIRISKREGNKGYFYIMDRETRNILRQEWMDIQEDNFLDCEYIQWENHSHKIYAD